VLRVTAMHHRHVAAAGMEGEVDRKIAHNYLASGGAQRPLVGQLHRAVVLYPGKVGRWPGVSVGRREKT